MNAVEERVAEIEGALCFNAVVINRDINGVIEDLVVRDVHKKFKHIKVPGGMMNECDKDAACWLQEIERLMREKKGSKFSDAEIEEIIRTEKKLIDLNDVSAGTHTMEEYGAIRESIEETGAWPRKIEIVHYWLKEKDPCRAESKPVHYRFFFAKEFSAPQKWSEDFISSDKEVEAKLWVRQEELLSKEWNDPKIIHIIGTHAPALEAMATKFPGMISEQISVWE